MFGATQTLNLGFGWDRTQNVLWRLAHGEFEGLHPKTVVINIGTNNLTGTANARANTPAEVVQGILAIHEQVRAQSPQSRIIVMGVFPRGFGRQYALARRYRGGKSVARTGPRGEGANDFPGYRRSIPSSRRNPSKDAHERRHASQRGGL